MFSTGGCFLAYINDVYIVDGEWYYEVDCKNYKEGLVLEGVAESYLGRSSNPKKYNSRISSKILSEMADMV